MNWQEFWAMGGHGFFVWSSFGIVAAVMVINVLQPLWSHRRQCQAIKQQTENRV